MDAAHLWGLNQAITSSRCSPIHSFNGTSSSLGEKKPYAVAALAEQLSADRGASSEQAGRMFMSSLVRNHR